MAADEHMAALFHKVGDAAQLAEQLISILQSPELEREMAEQNFAAGIEMTMTNVVANYLRWFELKKSRNALSNLREFSARGLSSLEVPEESNPSSGWEAPTSAFLAKDDSNQFRGLEPAGNYAAVDKFAGSFAENGPAARKHR
jgi:hypothetical protein